MGGRHGCARRMRGRHSTHGTLSASCTGSSTDSVSARSTDGFTETERQQRHTRCRYNMPCIVQTQTPGAQNGTRGILGGCGMHDMHEMPRTEMRPCHLSDGRRGATCRRPWLHGYAYDYTHPSQGHGHAQSFYLRSLHICARIPHMHPHVYSWLKRTT